MNKEIILPNNWRPRGDQLPLWQYLEHGGKRAVLVGHRRWGKDDVALHYTATAAHERIGNYWHMLPKYEQARKVIWDAINPRTGKKRIDEAFPLGIRKKTNQQKMMIEFNSGASWQLVGSDNYDQAVGTAPIGITFSEWALANPLAWAYLSPILAENGGFALFIFTSRGNNHGKKMFLSAQNNPEWFAQMIRANESPVFSPEILEEERANLHMTFGLELGEAIYQQEYFCSFEGAKLGAYYGKQIEKARQEGRVGTVNYDPRFEVYTAWDLGVDDSTTIWFFQVILNNFYFIDYYENSGEGTGHYAKIIKEKPYVYGDHFLPHDGEHRKMGEIVESPKEGLERLGVKPVIIIPRPKDSMSVLKGIGAGRNLLPRCFFDEKKCNLGIMALTDYSSGYDEVKKKLGDRPIHDWSSHGADAFRTFAVGYKPKVKTKSVTDYLNGRQ